MKKLRWLKSYQKSVIGEEFNAGEKSAENFVSQGFAEYVDEEDKKKLAKKLVAKATLETKENLIEEKNGIIPEDIINFYKIFRHSKETEIRAILKVKEKNKILNFFVHSEKELLEICETYNKKYNLYIGINERKEKGTKAEDVIAVGVIPIDIDCRQKPASDEDIAIAMTTAMQIIEDGKKAGFQTPSIVFSGNGYHLYFSIPKIEITPKNSHEIDQKVQTFLHKLIKTYSNDKILLDNVGDLPRIMRIAGTYNIRAGKYARLISANYEEDENMQFEILNISLELFQTKVMLTPELKAKVESDEIIKKLFDGDFTGFASRSEAELSLVCRLVKLELTKEQIFMVMASCNLGKWQESSLKYRETTYKKAVEIICPVVSSKVTFKGRGENEFILEEGGLDAIYKKPLKNYENPIEKGIEIIWEKDLKNFVAEKKQYILEKYIPSKSAIILTGKRGTLKSFFALAFGCCISQGIDFVGKYQTEKGKVIYIDQENGIEIIKERVNMIKTGLDLKEDLDIGFVCFSQLKLDNPREMEKFKAVLQKEKPQLIIIDTYRRAVSFDENDAGEVSKLFVDTLRPLIEEFNFSVLLIHHNRKSASMSFRRKKDDEDSGIDEMDELRGSSDLANYVDGIIKLERLGEKLVYIKQLKNRNDVEEKPQRIKVEFEGKENIRFSYDGELIFQNNAEKCGRYLMEWVAEKGIKEFQTKEAKEIAFTKGIKKQNFFKALEDLQSKGLIEKDKKGIYLVKI